MIKTIFLCPRVGVFSLMVNWSFASKYLLNPQKWPKVYLSGDSCCFPFGSYFKVITHFEEKLSKKKKLKQTFKKKPDY